MELERRITETIRDIQVAFGKHIQYNSWTSGSVTECCPITVWSRTIEVQLKTNDKRHFPQKVLDKFVAEHKDLLRSAHFVRNDGSCPSELVFTFHNPIGN